MVKCPREVNSRRSHLIPKLGHVMKWNFRHRLYPRSMREEKREWGFSGWDFFVFLCFSIHTRIAIFTFFLISRHKFHYLRKVAVSTDEIAAKIAIVIFTIITAKTTSFPGHKIARFLWSTIRCNSSCLRYFPDRHLFHYLHQALIFWQHY